MTKVRSPRVLAFVHEYVWGRHAGNGAKSLVAAGLGKGDVRKARRYAHEVLRKPAVKALVDAETAEKEAQLKQKAARTAEEVYRLATADIAKLFDSSGALLDVRKMPEDVRRAIASVEVEELFEGRGEDREQIGVVRKIKLHDKRAAQELFLKYAGKLKDKVEIEGLNLEQLVLAADRLARERQAQTK